MNKVVLDASALLAYFWDEPGADVVESSLDKGAVISVVNWAEVLSKAQDKGEDIEVFVEKVQKQQFQEFEILPLTKTDAIQIAKLRPKTKTLGLSLGDRACLALGLRLAVTVLTADKIWKNLSVGLPITVIR